MSFLFWILPVAHNGASARRSTVRTEIFWSARATFSENQKERDWEENNRKTNLFDYEENIFCGQIANHDLDLLQPWVNVCQINFFFPFNYRL